MVLRLELRIRHHGCPTESFHGGTVMMQLAGERGSDTFVLYADTEPEMHEALERSVEGVGGRRPHVLHRTRTSMAFQGRNLDDGIVAEIRESPCSILWPVVYRDGLERYTLVAPDRAAASGLVERLEGHGEVEVRAVREVLPEELEAHLPLSGLVSGLTRRQLEILQGAAAGGYYQRPKAVTTQQLAEAFDLAPSTLSEHLRKAEDHVILRFVELVDRYPALTQGTLKGPGRPPDLGAGDR